MDLNSRRTRTFLGLFVLCAFTFLAFSRSWHNGFINYDDGDYVTKNPHVLTGLTWANIRWALTSTRATNWNPVTWISHMVDVQLFGLNPAGHHLVSLLWHVVDAALLYLWLQWLTGAFWRSIFVAALFAVHPFHVESVAWVSERKDVLSAFFFLLTVWSYCFYARAFDPTSRGAGQAPLDPAEINEAESVPRTLSRSKLLYWLALVFYALGLMSKPILVTVPFVLLLLDFWPLSRLGVVSGTVLKRVFVEKIPFFCLAAGSSAATLLSQSEAYTASGGLPFALRLGTAITSYLLYLGKTLWPVRLCIFYPDPNARYFASARTLIYPPSEQWPSSQLVAGGVLLLAISVLVVVRRKKEPWWFVGWFWLLGTLVPVIGLMRAGVQVMADRYTYLPLIGLFVGVAWSAAELCGRSASKQAWFRAAGVLVLLACSGLTWRQVGYWRDNQTVFTHALSVAPRNSMAEWMVGAARAEQGQLGLAQTHFRLALEADPYQVEAHSALGSLFELQGRLNLATNEYSTTLRMKPQDEFARLHLADVLRKLGRPKEALAEYERAARWHPDSVEANYQAGALLLEAGDLQQAGRFLQAALRFKPDYADALLCLADLRSQQGRPGEAVSTLGRVVQLYPTNAELRVNYGSLLWAAGRHDLALVQYEEALRLNPSDPMIHYDLGTALFAESKLTEAAQHFRQALTIKPDYTQASLGLARVLSSQRQYQEAQEVLRSSIARVPSNATLHVTLGTTLLLTGETNHAQNEFDRAVQLQPGLGEQYVTEGKALLARGQWDPALARFETAVHLQSDLPSALSSLAWLLATHPRFEQRDGRRALSLAKHAVELAGKAPQAWAALDVAYAEVGDFEEALKAADKSKELAVISGDSRGAQAAQERTELYHAKLPFRLKNM